MRQKLLRFAVVLMKLAALLSFTGLFARNAYSMLQNPEVDVIPPEAYVGQQMLIKAKISVKSC